MRERTSGQKSSESISSHIVNVVQSPVRQGCPLLQPQVSADEQLSSRDRRRMLHIGQALHHHCGHPLRKHKERIFLALFGTLTETGLDRPDVLLKLPGCTVMPAYTLERNCGSLSVIATVSVGHILKPTIWLQGECKHIVQYVWIKLNMIYSTLAG